MSETAVMEKPQVTSEDRSPALDKTQTRKQWKLMRAASGMWEGLERKNDKSRFKTAMRRMNRYIKRHFKKDE